MQTRVSSNWQVLRFLLSKTGYQMQVDLKCHTKTSERMEGRISIYSPFHDIMKCNSRYVHITNWIHDIMNWIRDIMNSIRDIMNTIHDIMNWIHDIMNSIRDMCHVVHITNWIHDIMNWIHDIMNWIHDIMNWIHDIMNSIRDMYISRIAFHDIMKWRINTKTAFHKSARPGWLSNLPRELLQRLGPVTWERTGRTPDSSRRRTNTAKPTEQTWRTRWPVHGWFSSLPPPPPLASPKRQPGLQPISTTPLLWEP